jgi:glycerate kinase
MNAFKGTLSSLEVNQVIEEHLRSLGHHVISLPISDGGDGFFRCNFSQKRRIFH